MATGHDWQWHACQRTGLLHLPGDRLEAKPGHSPARTGDEGCADGHKEQSACVWSSELRLAT
jgi:hypothetical protein